MSTGWSIGSSWAQNTDLVAALPCVHSHPCGVAERRPSFAVGLAGFPDPARGLQGGRAR
ncbi:hypothetical protein PSD17_37000 [Pseudonocardia sp. D17]|jgi:hypothetical protein|nr:hypothetical protein PSD17_37000 [Pseudonocardia sp. D17]